MNNQEYFLTALTFSIAGWLFPFALPKHLAVIVSVSTSFILISLMYWIQGLVLLPGINGHLCLFLTTFLISAWLLSPGDTKKLQTASVALIGLFAVSLFATIFATNPNWFFGEIALLACAMTISSSKLNANQRLTVTWIIVILCVFQGILAIQEFFSEQYLLSNTLSGLSGHAFIYGHLRSVAFLGQPLILGFVMVLGEILLINLKKVNPLLKIVGSVIFLGGIFASGSASALVILILGIYLSVWSNLNNLGKFAFIFVTVFISLFAFISGSIPKSFFSQLDFGPETQRGASIAALPNLFTSQSPDRIFIGNGWGAEVSLFSEGIFESSRSNAIDNQFVSTLAVSGVIGLFMLIVVVFSSSFSMTKAKSDLFPALICTFFFMLSFDVLLWSISSLFLGFAISEGKPNDNPWQNPGQKTQFQKFDAQLMES